MEVEGEEEQARAVKRERLNENENENATADDQDPASRRVIRSEFLKLKTLINGNNLSILFYFLKFNFYANN